MSKIVESSGVSGVLIVLAFILVIIIIRQEKNLKSILVNLTKEVVESTSSSLTAMNENLIGIIESLNQLTLLYAKLSKEKSEREET